MKMRSAVENPNRSGARSCHHLRPAPACKHLPIHADAAHGARLCDGERRIACRKMDEAGLLPVRYTLQVKLNRETNWLARMLRCVTMSGAERKSGASRL